MTVIEAAIAAGALVIALLLAALGFEHHQLTTAKRDNVACQADRANFAATQKSNLGAIDDLTHRLQVQAEIRRVEKESLGKAISQADDEASQADDKARALTAQLDKLYAKDTHAAAWGTEGIDASVAAKLPGKRK